MYAANLEIFQDFLISSDLMLGSVKLCVFLFVATS